MFADTLRNANTESEIFVLLTSYMQTMRAGEKSHDCIPETITRLPLNGIGDVKLRFTQLMLELDKASKRLDNDSCAVIKESVHALSIALNRLQALNAQHDGTTH